MSILLFTDFGFNGPYVGQMKQAIFQESGAIPVIDLMHDVPSFDIESASCLLSALFKRCQRGDILVAVVDPGVGTTKRQPVIVRCDGRYLVGPDNGIFDHIIAAHLDAEIAVIEWTPASLSDSFHGRDLFAPVAARLFRGEYKELASHFHPVQRSSPTQDSKIIYQDHFGNCWSNLCQARLQVSDRLLCKGLKISYSRTFALVEPGQIFWYWNSQGLAEIAVNKGNAAEHLNACCGELLEILKESV